MGGKPRGTMLALTLVACGARSPLETGATSTDLPSAGASMIANPQSTSGASHAKPEPARVSLDIGIGYPDAKYATDLPCPVLSHHTHLTNDWEPGYLTDGEDGAQVSCRVSGDHVEGKVRSQGARLEIADVQGSAREISFFFDAPDQYLTQLTASNCRFETMEGNPLHHPSAGAVSGNVICDAIVSLDAGYTCGGGAYVAFENCAGQ